VNGGDQNGHCQKTPCGPRPDSNSDLIIDSARLIAQAICGNQYDGAEGGI
jgi:hypothetical protein